MPVVPLSGLAAFLTPRVTRTSFVVPLYNFCCRVYVWMYVVSCDPRVKTSFHEAFQPS